MNGWASTSHRTTSFAPPNSQGGAAGNRVSPLAFKWLATDATGCERAIFGNPRWTDAHRRTHRTTTSRRDQATRNGTYGRGSVGDVDVVMARWTLDTGP